MSRLAFKLEGDRNGLGGRKPLQSSVRYPNVEKDSSEYMGRPLAFLLIAYCTSSVARFGSDVCFSK